jgi:hypothetical protein
MIKNNVESSKTDHGLDVDRRSVIDQRSSTIDTRSVEQQKAEGERRSGVDRRSSTIDMQESSPVFV